MRQPRRVLRFGVTRQEVGRADRKTDVGEQHPRMGIAVRGLPVGQPEHLLQHLRVGLAVRRLQPDRDLRRLCLEAVQVGTKPFQHQRRHARYGDLGPGPLRLDIVACQPQPLEPLRDELQIDPGLRGQRHAPPVLDQKRQADVFLKQADLLADRARGHAQVLRRAVDRPKPPQRLEGLKRPQWRKLSRHVQSLSSPASR